MLLIRTIEQSLYRLNFFPFSVSLHFSFSPSRSISQPLRSPLAVIAPKPSSFRCAPTSVLTKRYRQRERAHSVANTESDTPLQKKKRRRGRPPKRSLAPWKNGSLEEKRVDMPRLRRKRLVEAQQRVGGMYSIRYSRICRTRSGTWKRENEIQHAHIDKEKAWWGKQPSDRQSSKDKYKTSQASGYSCN